MPRVGKVSQKGVSGVFHSRADRFGRRHLERRAQQGEAVLIDMRRKSL